MWTCALKGSHGKCTSRKHSNSDMRIIFFLKNMVKRTQFFYGIYWKILQIELFSSKLSVYKRGASIAKINNWIFNGIKHFAEMSKCVCEMTFLVRKCKWLKRQQQKPTKLSIPFRKSLKHRCVYIAFGQRLIHTKLYGVEWKSRLVVCCSIHD